MDTPPAGANVGEAIAAISAAKGKEIVSQHNPDQRFVAVWTEDVWPGRITVEADKYQHGVILVAGNVQPGKATSIIERCRAYRWVLNPVQLRLRRGEVSKSQWYIEGRGSIVPTSRIKLRCPVCKYEDTLWRDRAKRLHRQYGGTKTTFEAHGYQIPCKECLSGPEGKKVVCSTIKLRNVVFPNGEDSADPVLSSLDDPRRQAFQVGWEEQQHHTPDTHGIALPRIWAVYPNGQAPEDWVPQDDTAREIETRLNAKQTRELPGGFTLRPFGIAHKSGHPMLSTVLLEGTAEIGVGWTTRQELWGELDLGYKRKFVQPPRGYTCTV